MVVMGGSPHPCAGKVDLPEGKPSDHAVTLKVALG
jgi:hypothetical protein